MDAEERFAASYDWDLVVVGNYLVFLQSRHQAGEFSAEQEGRYRQLKADLEAAQPIIEQLGLARPQEIVGG